jgi:hypothetical protein
MGETGWARTFDDPIELAGGRVLRTLRDADEYVTALSKAPIRASRTGRPPHMNGVDTQTWLADVLTLIAAHPAHRLDELLLWNWTPRTAAPPLKRHDHATLTGPSRHHHYSGR